MNRFACALSICSLSLAAFSASAEEPQGPNLSEQAQAKPEASPQTLIMRAYHLGAALLDQARDYESVSAMLAAVELLGRVTVEDSDTHFGEKSEEAGEEAGDAPAPAETPEKDSSAAADVGSEALLAYLDEAAGWAEGDPASLTLIQAKRGEVQALGGAVTMGAMTDDGHRSPIRHVDQVGSKTVDVYRVKFEGGRSAQLMVIGDGDTDLDLRIYDENDNLIAEDLDLTDNCVVEWTPKWTGTFRIEIENLGDVYNRYSILSN